ncbi:MAG: hypothetical protein ACK4KV_13335, partial [Rhodocyclaceae bacterium]
MVLLVEAADSTLAATSPTFFFGVALRPLLLTPASPAFVALAFVALAFVALAFVALAFVALAFVALAFVALAFVA